ncbi:MAG: alpha/beta hydrolase [Hyphomicrobiales bacterium]|nr:alpha/beta hydrolase [Hyphomicrobiales bacterium]
MDLADLFPGFEAHTIDVGEVKLFCRLGGREDAPPLLLLHGFPESHVMWAKVAPRLAEYFRLVIPDLRGYGWSSVPAVEPDHAQMSKRRMAADMVALMDEFGHDRFALAGHDRGARVGYRLALDRPDKVSRLALLDIVPTLVMWETMEKGIELAPHWRWLAAPAPEPEERIGRDADGWLNETLAAWTRSKDLKPFGGKALAHYHAFFTVPERLSACCEDYRAGATLDRAADEADLASGRRIQAPTRALWGAGGFPAQTGISPIDAWARFMADRTLLDGEAIPSGHFLAEEAPEATLAALLPFLLAG